MQPKQEFWWIVVGDPEKNKLFYIKRVTFAQNFNTLIKFKSPDAGNYKLLVYLICDCFVGCDQQVCYSYSRATKCH